MRKILLEWYGETGDTINDKSTYWKIVNNRHFDRVNKLRQYYLDNDPNKIAIGGENDEEFGPHKVNKSERHLPPMVLKDIDFDNDEIMKEEIFGPILSIIPMNGTFTEWVDDSIKYIRSGDKPLALYIFSADPKNDNILKIKNSISAGTVCINDTVMFLGLKDFPFGGIGESGMGRYGGMYSFKLFSQAKPIATSSHGREFFNKDRYPIYPPSQEKEEKLKKMYIYLLPTVQSKSRKCIKYSLIILSIVGIVVAAYFISKYY